MAKIYKPQNLDIIFEALANKHRREIIYALGLHPHSISQLAAQQKLSLPAIHKHVKILERAGLILRKKIKQTNFLALNRETLHSLQEWLMQYHAYWGSSEETLENYTDYLSKKDPPSLKLWRASPPTLKLRPSARRSPTARGSRRGKEGGEKKK